MRNINWASQYKPTYEEHQVDDFYSLNINKHMKGYSFWKGFWKAVTSMALVGLPILLQILPSDWLNMTVGGIAVLVLNFLKFSYKKA